MERADLARLLGAKGTTAAGGQLVAESDPRRFMVALADAIADDGEVFLGDPGWGDRERAQWSALKSAGCVAPKPASGEGGWLMIPTGGSTGGLKFARHDAGTIASAVQGFRSHFNLDRVNAAGVLPLWHVSGLMAWMRCALSGGEYRPLDWREVEAGGHPALPVKKDGWSISLVPTQLERLLRSERTVEWLRGFRLVFVGGGPSQADLLVRAGAARLPVVLSYGMTETAAMVAAQREGDFLRGDRTCGPAMPHARLSVRADGIVRVQGPSVFHGYYPEWREAEFFATADEGTLDGQGRLTIRQRRDLLIISGGEKINPEEIEAVLRATGEFTDVAVVGVPDAEWGQKVVAVYPAGREPDAAKLKRALRDLLPAYKRPKLLMSLAEWPRTAAGKLNRTELARLTAEAIRAGGPRTGQ